MFFENGCKLDVILSLPIVFPLHAIFLQMDCNLELFGV